MPKPPPNSFADALNAFFSAGGGSSLNRPARRPKPKPAKPRKPTAAQRRTWKMVIVNQEPIRRAATEAYQKASQNLNELRAAVERFSTKDRPAYESWLAATFGALLTEYRETCAKVDEKGRLLEAVRMMSILGRLSPYDAYQRVMNGKTAIEEARAKQQAARESGGADASEDEKTGEEEDEFFEDDDDFDAAGNATAGNPSRSGKRGRTRKSRGDDEAPVEERTISQRLKTAYRAIVRRLHPDLNPDLTAYDRQLWYDAQTAYEKEDLESLETILAVGELARGGELPANSGIAGLLALTRKTEGSIQQLQKQIREFKRGRVWNFTGLVSKDALKRKVEAGLRTELAEEKAELAVIERELEFCQRPPPPRKPKQPAAAKKKLAQKPVAKAKPGKPKK